MNLVYLILAHRHAEQLARLITTIQTPNSTFVVHIDAKTEINTFSKLLKISGKKVQFVQNRCISAWGTYGLVQATINSLQHIKLLLPNTDRVVLLSGQDYPIKPMEHIYSFLEQNRDTIFMEYFSIPTEKWFMKGKSRFPYFDRVSKVMKFYGGSQWWSFPMIVVDFILNCIEENNSFTEYFQKVIFADESFFQTLLLNSEESFILNNLKNDNLHLIKWDPPYKHPRTLKSSDALYIKKCKYLFARKFDIELDVEILNHLDKNVLYRESCLAKN